MTMHERGDSERDILAAETMKTITNVVNTHDEGVESSAKKMEKVVSKSDGMQVMGVSNERGKEKLIPSLGESFARGHGEDPPRLKNSIPRQWFKLVRKNMRDKPQPISEKPPSVGMKRQAMEVDTNLSCPKKVKKSCDKTRSEENNTMKLTTMIGGAQAPPITMIYLCWNARGLGRSRTFRNPQRLVSNHSPDLLFISESRVSKCFTRNWCYLFKFHGFFYVDAFGRSGGLILFWKK